MKRNRLFILSAGGLLGVDIHAGFLKALHYKQIYPNEIIGTSAGAIVSAFISAGYDINECIDILTKLEDKDIYRKRIFWQIRFPFLKYYLDNTPLRKLLLKWLPEDKYGYKIPCSVITINWDTLQTEVFSTKNIDDSISFIDCVIASTSIAGIFPIVRINNNYYSDGSVRDNIYIPDNINDYDEIWILIASINPKSRKYEDNNMIDRLKKQLDILAFDQIFDIYDMYKTNNKFKFLFYNMNINEDIDNILKFKHSIINSVFFEALEQINDIIYYNKNNLKLVN